MNTHAINLFEIPVADFDRARKFYEPIFACRMPENTVGPDRMGYLDCAPNVQTVLERMALNGME